MVDELSVADLEVLGLTAPVSRAKHTYRTPMSQEFDLIDPFAIKIGNRFRQGTDERKIANSASCFAIQVYSIHQ